MSHRSSSDSASDPILPTIRKAAAPLRSQVVDELRQSIVAGRLAPGVRLIERELISMLGVSRMVIREALRQLESEGLVAIIPHKGPIVRQLSLAEARDHYAIRGVLEGLAAKLFVENASAGNLHDLRNALDSTIAAYEDGNPETILQTKNRFYDVLFKGAGSETLATMVATLHARIWRWRALGLGHPRRSPKRSKESIENLRALLAALNGRDAALAEKIICAENAAGADEVIRLIANEA